jgi:hypothetical protein
MSKREFTMLAHKFDEKKHNPSGWHLSDKLDGLRIIWDGGISRGLHVSEVPFANTEKDYRYINQDIRATGLWSRGGKIIYAPGWFLDQLPPFCLDGEIHSGLNSWQLTASIIKDLIPNENDWKLIKYSIFDSPSYEALFSNGEIDYRSHKKTLSGVVSWAEDRVKQLGLPNHSLKGLPFEFLYNKLLKLDIENDFLDIHKQIHLPYNRQEALEIIESKLEEVTSVGGEGLMLRKSESLWVPERSYNLLKVKKWNDSEGIVKGYIWGRKTDKGSKLLGKMGALILDWQGKTFELSGFTDAEREMIYESSGNLANDIGRLYPGQRVENGIINPNFPIGSKITFKYRELSDRGIPKEGRYYRKPSNLEVK